MVRQGRCSGRCLGRTRVSIVGVVGVCMVQCFVIALEVLDNLPHDKVLWVPKPQAQALEGTQAPSQGWELHEAIVRCGSTLAVLWFGTIEGYA